MNLFIVTLIGTSIAVSVPKNNQNFLGSDSKTLVKEPVQYPPSCPMCNFNPTGCDCGICMEKFKHRQALDKFMHECNNDCMVNCREEPNRNTGAYEYKCDSMR